VLTHLSVIHIVVKNNIVRLIPTGEMLGVFSVLSTFLFLLISIEMTARATALRNGGSVSEASNDYGNGCLTGRKRHR
jgi:hypothetical protein